VIASSRRLGLGQTSMPQDVHWLPGFNFNVEDARDLPQRLPLR
jgi:hypothetical protein